MSKVRFFIKSTGMLFCFFLILLSAASAETVTGYFDTVKLVRPGPVRAGESIGTLPPYEPLVLEKQEENWGTFTMEDGRTGYVFYAGILPMPDITDTEPRFLTNEKATEVLNFPSENGSVRLTAEPRTVFMADGEYGDYLRVTLPDGKTRGYIPRGRLSALALPSLEEEPDTLVISVKDAPLYSRPFVGTERTGTLFAETPLPAYSELWAGFAAVNTGDSVCFVSLRDARLMTRDPETGLPGFVSGQEGIQGDPDTECVLQGARVNADKAELLGTDGAVTPLNKGDSVFIYSRFGDFAAVTANGVDGFLPDELLSPVALQEKEKELSEKALPTFSVIRTDILDRAFAMLEQGNSLLIRYNAGTGAGVTPLFDLGVPYFWGGKSENVLMERYPLYTTRLAWQSSPVYYKKDVAYLSGFDCTGFVKILRSQVKRPIAESFTELDSAQACRDGLHVFCQEEDPLPEDPEEVARVLEVGDILVIRHPGRHAMMFIGTLRDYGYTEEQVPELSAFLDHPLMIHCSEDPFCYFRFRYMIACSDDARIARAVAPDGGVCLCLYGATAETAERVIGAHGLSYPCFDLEGSNLGIMDPSTFIDYYVLR